MNAIAYTESEGGVIKPLNELHTLSFARDFATPTVTNIKLRINFIDRTIVPFSVFFNDGTIYDAMYMTQPAEWHHETLGFLAAIVCTLQDQAEKEKEYARRQKQQFTRMSEVRRTNAAAQR